MRVPGDCLECACGNASGQRLCSIGNIFADVLPGLQEHAEGSVECAEKDCAMLFGSTGAGKSTLMHLLAGAKFARETVEVADDDEFGLGIDMQLVADMSIPGCEIGNTASSTTMLLNSYHDKTTFLTYVDTPGFNNVGDEKDDDTTVDAANSAAIMRTIRSCGTLRIVFLISVKDELNTTRGGQIKRLFEVMDKFIKDASSRLASVFMLFTHCDGFPSASQGMYALQEEVARITMRACVDSVASGFPFRSSCPRR